MRKFVFLIVFLISLSGFGQLTIADGNKILADNGIKQGVADGLWSGRCQGIYETLNGDGVFIYTQEWIVEDSIYRVSTYRFFKNKLDRVTALDGYVVYDYSKDKNLFLVRYIGLVVPYDGRSISGEDIFTYSFNDKKPKFQIADNKEKRIQFVEFIDDFLIQYKHYNSTESHTQRIR